MRWTRRWRHVERPHRQLVVAGEAENRHVEFWWKAPDVLPVGARQEIGLRELTGDPGVEDRLGGAREHLEPQHDARVRRIQALEGRQLPAVIRGAVVVFAKQDDRAMVEVSRGISDATQGGWRRPAMHRRTVRRGRRTSGE